MEDKRRKKTRASDAASTLPRTSKRGAKRTTAGSGLTADRIRTEALKLIDEGGLEAFSTRKLGAALGCEAMAIYWYYPSKDALLDAVVEGLVSRLPVDPADSGDWIDALRKLAHAYRRLAHRHPRAFPLLAMRRFATEGTFRFLDGLFALARDEGLDDRTIARFFRLVSSYCSGAALDELAGLRDQERAAERAGAEPPAEDKTAGTTEDFPRLAAVSAWLEPSHYDDVFEFGLELLLDALAKAPRTSKASKPKSRRS